MSWGADTLQQNIFHRLLANHGDWGPDLQISPRSDPFKTPASKRPRCGSPKGPAATPFKAPIVLGAGNESNEHNPTGENKELTPQRATAAATPAVVASALTPAAVEVLSDMQEEDPAASALTPAPEEVLSDMKEEGPAGVEKPAGSEEDPMALGALPPEDKADGAEEKADGAEEDPAAWGQFRDAQDRGSAAAAPLAGEGDKGLGLAGPPPGEATPSHAAPPVHADSDVYEIPPSTVLPAFHARIEKGRPQRCMQFFLKFAVHATYRNSKQRIEDADAPSCLSGCLCLAIGSVISSIKPVGPDAPGIPPLPPPGR